MRIGLRSMRRHPRLALVFVASAITQGTFQGLVILAVHQVLLRLSDEGTVSSSNLVLGAVLIFGTWALRSVSTFAGELAQARLASRVEIELDAAGPREAGQAVRPLL